MAVARRRTNLETASEVVWAGADRAARVVELNRKLVAKNPGMVPQPLVGIPERVPIEELVERAAPHLRGRQRDIWVDTMTRNAQVQAASEALGGPAELWDFQLQIAAAQSQVLAIGEQAQSASPAALVQSYVTVDPHPSVVNLSAADVPRLGELIRARAVPLSRLWALFCAELQGLVLRSPEDPRVAQMAKLLPNVPVGQLFLPPEPNKKVVATPSPATSNLPRGHWPQFHLFSRELGDALAMAPVAGARTVLRIHMLEFSANNGGLELHRAARQIHDPANASELIEYARYALNRRVGPEVEPFEAYRHGLRAALLTHFEDPEVLRVLAQAFAALGDDRLAQIAQIAAGDVPAGEGDATLRDALGRLAYQEPPSFEKYPRLQGVHKGDVVVEELPGFDGDRMRPYELRQWAENFLLTSQSKGLLTIKETQQLLGAVRVALQAARADRYTVPEALDLLARIASEYHRRQPGGSITWRQTAQQAAARQAEILVQRRDGRGRRRGGDQRQQGRTAR